MHSMLCRYRLRFRLLFRHRHAARFALAAAFAIGASPVQAASFDCSQAKQPDERAICASRQLSEMDVEMAVRYETLTGLVAMGARGDMGDEQRTWLRRRAKCGSNRQCLSAAYRARIDVLKQEYQNLKSRGPF